MYEASETDIRKHCGHRMAARNQRMIRGFDKDKHSASHPVSSPKVTSHLVTDHQSTLIGAQNGIALKDLATGATGGGGGQAPAVSVFRNDMRIISC
jgi:hypothetical protein